MRGHPLPPSGDVLRSVGWTMWTVRSTKWTVISTMWTVRSTKWTVRSTMWTVRSTKWTVRSTMWTVRSTKCFFKSIIYISSINPCVLKYDIVSPLRGTISLKKGYLLVARDTSDTQLVLGAIRKLCQNVWRMVTFLAFCLWLWLRNILTKVINE